MYALLETRNFIRVFPFCFTVGQDTSLEAAEIFF
jgi:hypothetical protein